MENNYEKKQFVSIENQITQLKTTLQTPNTCCSSNFLETDALNTKSFQEFSQNVNQLFLGLQDSKTDYHFDSQKNIEKSCELENIYTIKNPQQNQKHYIQILWTNGVQNLSLVQFNQKQWFQIKKKSTQKFVTNKLIQDNNIKKNILKILIPQNSIKQNIKIKVRLSSRFNRQLFFQFPQPIIESQLKIDNLMGFNYFCQNIHIQPENKKCQKNCIILYIAKIQEVMDLQSNLLNKSEKLNEIKSLTQLQGILFQLAKQNMGSRIIQKLLSKNHQEFTFLYYQLYNHFSELMKDNYGNYVMQKLIVYSSQQKLYQILIQIQNQIKDIATTKPGTHCLQFMLQKIQNKKIIYPFIKNNQIQICQNQFGTHFMQKFLKFYCFNEQIMEFYLKKQPFLQLACHKHGVLCLKTLLNILCPYYYNCSLNRTRVLKIIQSQVGQQLLIDQFGHYLLQQIIIHFFQWQMKWLLEIILTNLKKYAMNQFAVNVIKKGLFIYKYKWSFPMIQIIQQSKQLTLNLLQNKLGSFILHRLLDESYYLKPKFESFLKERLKYVENNVPRQKWRKHLGC